MGDKKPYLAVVLIQSIYAAMFLLSKAAFDVGMNNFVFVFYRQAAATVFLVPLGLAFQWKKAPPLSFVTFCKIFMIAFCGITLSLDVNGMALVYTSATLAAATTNCLPVITFFFALLLGVEVLRLKTRAGMAKVGGIVICLMGAAALALYKGPHFSLWHQNDNSFGSHHHQTHVSSGKNWIMGCFLMLLSNTFWGLWLVLQASVLKSYPSKLLFTSLQCFSSCIQSFVIAIALVRDPNEWKLGWNVQLLAVAYCGVVVTGLTYYLQTWVIEKKGPVFLAMSTPLSFIITIFCSAIFLRENITLGSILGGLLLVGGLYSVLWGKSREQRLNDEKVAAEVEEDSLELKEQVTTKTVPPPYLV